MTKKISVDAVEMVRRIRDEHYEQLRDMNPEERIAFYRAKARLLQVRTTAQLRERKVKESQTA